MTDFEVMGIMAKEDMDISLLPDCIETKIAKGGGKVTFGVPEKVHHIIANQLFSGNTTHYAVMYLINKEQFEKIKAEGEQQPNGNGYVKGGDNE